MSLRKLARPISFILFFGLFAWYSRQYFREVREDVLIRTWTLTFHRLDSDCVYWIILRMAGWVCIYLCLLRLESGFSVYMFLRHRSFSVVFVRTYVRCISVVLSYYGLGTLVMAVCHRAMEPGAELGQLLWQSRLPGILGGECMGCLSFCLAAYLVYCIFRKVEVGFLTVLAARLFFGFAVGGERPGLLVQTVLAAVMTGMAFCVAFYNFKAEL